VTTDPFSAGEELSIEERLSRLLFNATDLLVWWRLEQDSVSNFRFSGSPDPVPTTPSHSILVEETTLEDLLLRLWDEGLLVPIPEGHSWREEGPQDAA